MQNSELSIKTDWSVVEQQDADEAKIPAFLFVLCKSVTEDSSGGLLLTGTVVQRTLWEGEPPPRSAETDAPYFQVDLKGPLPGGRLEERRWEKTEVVNGTSMVHATINLYEAPIDIQPHWSSFPFRIFKGTVELELQAKLVGKHNKKMLCPDLCTLEKYSHEHVKRLVKVKGGMSRCRTLAFVQDRPTIEICGDRRESSSVMAIDDNPTPTFTTYPLMKLTFWLHEPGSKAMFEIFGPLLLVLVLMLVNFKETYGFETIRDWLNDETRHDHADYLANVIAISIAAVVVVPSIRSTSVISSVHSFTVDDAVAVVFVFGLALSAWPHPVVACVGCLLSCLVVLGALVSFVVYMLERRRIVNEECSNPVRVIHPKGDAVKSSARNFAMEGWTRAGQAAKERTNIGAAAAPQS